MTTRNKYDDHIRHGHRNLVEGSKLQRVYTIMRHVIFCHAIINLVHYHRCFHIPFIAHGTAQEEIYHSSIRGAAW